MTNLLVTIHALAGILSVFTFLFVFVELLNPTEKSVARIKIFSLAGTILIFVSWIIGGYYYVNYYGLDVKPLIKKGATPWVHSLIMETKEHVFLFLPFLAVLISGVILRFKEEIFNKHKAKLSVLILSGLIIFLELTIAMMGYMISAAARMGGV